MLCMRCGKETPEGSTFCENCGFALEDQPVAEIVDSVEEADASLGQNTPSELEVSSESPEERESEELFLEVPLYDCGYDDWDNAGYDLSSSMVEAMDEPIGFESFVDPPAGPEEPDLGRQRITVIAVISVLFAAVLVLLVCVVALRLFGF